MYTDIYYRDLTRTDALENFLLDRVETLVAKFLPEDPNAHLIIRVETERHRTQNRKPLFTCEVLLKSTHSKRIIKVHKANDDFQSCIADTCDALKHILSHMNSRRTNDRRRATAVSYLPPERAAYPSEVEYDEAASY